MIDFYGFVVKNHMALALSFLFLAMLSLPLEFILMSVMKKNRPGIEDEIEEMIYGKGMQGKYKAMLEVMEACPAGNWFARGVILERWLRILGFSGFVLVVLITYLSVSR